MTSTKSHEVIDLSNKRDDVKLGYISPYGLHLHPENEYDLYKKLEESDGPRILADHLECELVLKGLETHEWPKECIEAARAAYASGADAMYGAARRNLCKWTYAENDYRVPFADGWITRHGEIF